MNYHEKACFIKDYSTVNPKEDRATLIEFVMVDQPYYLEDTDYKTSTEYAESYPGLKAKLDIMASEYEKWFGKKYW